MKSNLQCSLNSQQLWEDPYKSVSQSPKSDGSGKTVKKVFNTSTLSKDKNVIYKKKQHI